jgi:hypothetical protein
MALLCEFQSAEAPPAPPPCTFKLTEVILLSSQNFFSVRKKITLLNLYQVISRLVTRLKFSYTPPIQVSDVLILAVLFRLIDLSFKYSVFSFLSSSSSMLNRRGKIMWFLDQLVLDILDTFVTVTRYTKVNKWLTAPRARGVPIEESVIYNNGKLCPH